MSIKILGNIKLFRQASESTEAIRFDQMTNAVSELVDAHINNKIKHPSIEEVELWNKKLVSGNEVEPVENKVVKLKYNSDGLITGSTEIKDSDFPTFAVADIKDIEKILKYKVKDGQLSLISNIVVVMDDVNHKITMYLTDGNTEWTEDIIIPISSPNEYGLLSSIFADKIKNMKASIDSIESSIGVLPAHDFEKEELTNEDIDEYIETISPNVTIINGTSITNKFNNHRWIYSGSLNKWIDNGPDKLSLATDTTPGIIRSLDATLGYISVDPETGNCYVLGLQNIIDSVKSNRVRMLDITESDKQYILSVLSYNSDEHLELTYSIGKDGETKLNTQNILIYDFSGKELSEIDGELLEFDAYGRLVTSGMNVRDLTIGREIRLPTIHIENSVASYDAITENGDRFTFARIDPIKMFPQTYHNRTEEKAVGLGVFANNIANASVMGDPLIGRDIRTALTFSEPGANTIFRPTNIDGSLSIDYDPIKGYLVSKI